MKTILYDVDGTLFNFEKKIIQDLNAMNSPNEQEITALYREDIPDHLWDRMTYIKNQPGWWFTLPKIDNGFKLWEFTKNRGFRHVIVAKAPSCNELAIAEKIINIRKHFGRNVPFHIVSDEESYVKTDVKGDIIVEDSAMFAENWLEANPLGWSILMDNKYNKDFNHDRCVRFNGAFTEELRGLIDRF